MPRVVRWLLRLSPVPRDTCGDVQDDLCELFVQRRHDRGAAYAHWRLYRDVASLWLPHRSDDHPSTSPLGLLRDVGADLRYAARLFARQPAILLLTVLGLSLGLGIATATFSIMNAAALRGEGLVDSSRLPAVLRTTDRSTATAWTYDEFVRLREGATKMQVEGVLTDAAIVRTAPSDAAAPSISVAFISGGFFAATGGRMALGRPLDTADERGTYQGGAPPVVVSHVYWTSRLDRDPAVVGRSIWIGRTAGTIVGVADRGFSVPNNRLLWMPLTAYGAVYSQAPASRTPAAGIQVFGRLLPGVAIPEAEAQLGGVAASLPGMTDSALRVHLDPHAGLGRMALSDMLGIAVFVSAVIALVLLLACANVATVLVATAITREREMGVRAALGASRSRIVRQLITESLALGTVAAAIGLLLASWAIPAIGAMIEAPAGSDLAPDLTVYLFLVVVTLFTGVCAGLAPAWHNRGADLVAPLKGEGARQDRLAPRRLRSLLVVTQAAVSVLLIVLSALFVRATFLAASVDVGFDASSLYAVSPGLGDPFAEDGARTRRFWMHAVPQLERVPGIAAVALADPAPFGDLSRTAITRERPQRVISLNHTSAGFFDTLGVRLLAGRAYTRDDVASKAPVVVVSETLARIYWHGQSPLGQMLPAEIPVASTRPVVIGVVADAITARLHERSAFAIYEPLDPADEKFALLLIRVVPGGSGVIQQASQRLRAIDPQADVRITSVASRLEEEAGRPRMLATLTGIVGAIAIVLCVIGLYGLTASLVNQRSREMGVRVALGAVPRDLLRLLMWDSLRPVVLGLAIGAGAALLAGRLVAASMFFGVSPQDPIALAGAAAILLAAASLAVLLPTRRAAAVDAAFVLRRS